MNVESLSNPLVTSNKTNKRRIRSAALVILAIAVLLLLNFHLLTGQFQDQHQLFTSTFGREGPQEIQMNQDMDLYVIGTNWATRAMAAPLARALEENMYTGTVTLREGPPQKTDHPVMVIRVEEADLLWAAVYARAHVRLHVSYGTNGEVDWMDDETVVTVPGPYTKYVSGEFETTTSAFGLTSLPGYANYLGQHIGKKINDGIEGALKN